MQLQRRSAAGLEYLLLEPEQPRDDSPTIVALHGRGASAEGLVGLLTWLGSEGVRFVLPNGPIPIVNAPWQSGHAWYQVGRELDATIARSRGLLLALADELEGRHGVARGRSALIGFSQGAVMALDVGLRSPDAFAGVVAMGGYLHAPETLGPALRAGRERRVLVLHGTYDDVISVDGARLARDVLEAAGLEPEYRELPLGHQVSPASLTLVRAFLERVLPRDLQPVRGTSE